MLLRQQLVKLGPARTRLGELVAHPAVLEEAQNVVDAVLRLRRADPHFEAPTTGSPRAIHRLGRRPLRPAEQRRGFSSMNTASSTQPFRTEKS
jgi:hypothetical protein